jgi:hypothetical protein
VGRAVSFSETCAAFQTGIRFGLTSLLSLAESILSSRNGENMYIRRIVLGIVNLILIPIPIVFFILIKNDPEAKWGSILGAVFATVWINFALYNIFAPETE